MSTATIRLTESGDVPFLPNIERSAGQLFRALPELAWIADDQVLPETAHRRLLAMGTSWVAVDGDPQAPVGFVCAETFDAQLHIWELAVAQGRQGAGLGRALMAACMQHARRLRLDAVTLTTFRDVPWNAPFYARLGFEALATTALSERLQEHLAQESAAGLPLATRCAMRWEVI